MLQFFNGVPVISVTKFARKFGVRKMVDTISECSDQNVQLRRLTGVFARRTGRIGKPGDYRSEMRLVKALIRLLMCRLIRLIVPVFVGFVMHTHMRIVCANLDGKIFNR